jgi:hypothetical protein
MRRVESSDGVPVAVHDLGGRGPALLISHATGFNAHSYLPMAAALPARQKKSLAISFDPPCSSRGVAGSAIDRPTQSRVITE